MTESETHSFLDVFNLRFAPLLEKRTESFRLLFSLMEKRVQEGASLHIVETGCARQPNNFAGDGMSTNLFDTFVMKYSQCQFDSFDINPQSCLVARSYVRERANVRIHCMDAVRGLWEYPLQRIDVLYLDSFDVDFANPHPSSKHHLKELCVAMNKLSKGALIMVDDNAGGRGKGTYVREVMETIGAKILYDGYQILFEL